MRHAPTARAEDEPSSSSEADSDDVESAEEDKPEEELLIAHPDLYERLRPWGRREVLAAGACIMAWYATSVSAIVANKTLLRSRRYVSPFFMSTVYMAVKWLLSRLLLLCMRRPPLVFRRCVRRAPPRRSCHPPPRRLTLNYRATCA